MRIDYVIHGVNDNPLYADFWPIVSEIWSHKFRVTPILFKLSDKETDFFSDPYGGLIKEIKQVEGINSALQSQIIRLYGPKYFPDQTCLISDLDMLPISTAYFCDQVAPYETASYINYCSDAYPQDSRYPMCYNLATGKTFQQVFDLPESFEVFAQRLSDFGWG